MNDDFEFRDTVTLELPPTVAAEWLALSGPHLRIMNFYVMAEADQHYGAVMGPATKIAAFLGMNRSQFARDVRELTEAGWLQEVTRIGNIRYYGVGPKVTGETAVTSNVVELRRRTA